MLFLSSHLITHHIKDWKTAHISPIFKKGALELASNYGPISLTSLICKIMESIIKDEIMMHLKNKNYFAFDQSVRFHRKSLNSDSIIKLPLGLHRSSDQGKDCRHHLF